jgi:hypothetical protein
MKWLNVVGLIFNLVGAGVIAAGVLASRAAVDRIAAALEVGLGPAAQADRRRQSSFAIVGLGALCIGFLLQLIASWPK